ncbi:MAG: serine/threonine protein kinase [Methanosarcinaceae archaeon]|nr:serine/threonine protein kinase [Methanosarcinaceae archaeon]
MIDDVLKVFRELDSKDFRILTGIEICMKDYEWVPVGELIRYTRMTAKDLEYRLSNLIDKNMVIGTRVPYPGYRIYFDGYDALAINTFVKRGTIDGIGDEIGVGKESVVHEALKEPELAIGDAMGVIIKFHREGRTSFRSIKRSRSHLEDREHFSWIYASRLAAKREYDIMKELYPEVSLPEPIDHSRHAIVMAPAKGHLLVKSRLEDPEIFLQKILSQMRIIYSLGIIHSDFSEYNIFVDPDGVEIIDWPQYVTLEHPHAQELLERDLSNILTHFERKYEVHTDLEDAMIYVKGDKDKFE